MSMIYHRKRLLAVLLMLFTVWMVGVVWAAPGQQANLFQLFLLNTQADVEVLADEVFGATRPLNWTVNEDLTSPAFVADLWFNNEQLADEVFGVGVRPESWIGASSPNPEILARNVRHDLEITADQVFGDARTRPQTWVGARPLYRCSQTLQNLLRILDANYNVRPTTPDSVVDYCGSVTLELEDTLFPPILQGTSAGDRSGELLSGLRGDLERLADERLGLGTRPPNWVGNRDAADDNFINDLVTDLEALANNELGTGIRPEGWLGQVESSPSLTYTNLRFNLEVLADQTLGEGTRPTGWQGTNQLERCDITLQNLVFVVEQQITLIPFPQDAPNSTAFCEQVTDITNNLAENPPVEEAEIVSNENTSRSRLAFSYLDVAALQYMGIMPYDTEFRAWYRNFNESNMMFVSGDGFALFIDRRFTTITEEIFRRLPTLEGRRPLTFCDANWCNGPGPTPTPTGDDALVLLLAASTPEPTRSVEQVEESGKRLVSWSNIRTNYLLYRTELGTVQVTLEICSDPSQVACEPVLTVFDNTTSTLRPVISQFNGLNVYEFRYGYQSNFIIEGATLFSRDILISDPSILTQPAPSLPTVTPTPF